MSEARLYLSFQEVSVLPVSGLFLSVSGYKSGISWPRPSITEDLASLQSHPSTSVLSVFLRVVVFFTLIKKFFLSFYLYMLMPF